MSRSARPQRRPDRAAGADAPAAYANHFEVGYNAFEFLFDFAQEYEGVDATPRGHARIVTAPAYAKVFRSLLDRSIKDYEAVFGPITQPDSAENQADTSADRPTR